MLESKASERHRLMISIHERIKTTPGIWLSAQAIADMCGTSRHRTAWALKKLVRDEQLINRVVKTERTRSRSYEQRKEYCYLYRERIGTNKWLEILGVSNIPTSSDMR